MGYYLLLQLLGSDMHYEHYKHRPLLMAKPRYPPHYSHILGFGLPALLPMGENFLQAYPGPRF